MSVSYDVLPTGLHFDTGYELLHSDGHLSAFTLHDLMYVGQRWCHYSPTGSHGCTRICNVDLCELNGTSFMAKLTWPYLCLSL